MPALPGASDKDAYTAVRAYRRELGRQLDDVEGKRQQLVSQLNQSSGPDRMGLEKRMPEFDRRIADLDKQIATADAQVAAAASIPGAVVPEPTNDGPSEELIIIPVLFILCVFLPLSIAYARRIWKRTGTAVAAFPRELSDRLGRLEQGMESTAVEVERIGEGQRFLTRLFTEGPGARLMGQSGGDPVRLPGGGDQNRG